jgi:hypothetical protein
MAVGLPDQETSLGISDAARAKLMAILGKLIAQTGKMQTY